jgi:hypothetical protein
VGVYFENDLADRRATDKLALDSCWTDAIARHLAAGDDNGVVTPPKGKLTQEVPRRPARITSGGTSSKPQDSVQMLPLIPPGIIIKPEARWRRGAD